MTLNFIPKNWILAGALLAFGSLTLSADTISTFNIDGTLTITSTGVTWTLSESPFTADKTIIAPGATGLYTGLGGTDATIDNLSTSTLSGSPFLSFDAAPGLSTLDITGFLPGFGAPAGCALTPPAVGQMCTPTGTPATFINTSRNSAALDFDLTGVTADGSGTWEGDFSTQFGESYQALLATLGAGGSASNTYSATFTVTTSTSPVPEPTAIGVSLLGIGLMALRARRSRAA